MAYFYFHAFGGRPDSRVVVSCFLHHLVDASVGVLRIIMEKNELLGAAFHHDIHGFAPVTVSPAALADLVFLGKVLSVVDQYVRAFRKLADALVECGIAGFVIGCIYDNALVTLHPKAHATLRMIEPSRLDRDQII